jgi:hypothetical protein
MKLNKHGIFLMNLATKVLTATCLEVSYILGNIERIPRHLPSRALEIKCR